MGTMIQDVRYALRMLAKSPGFTIVAVLTLALGIGATGTIFAWINSTLLDPIPGAAHVSELVALAKGSEGDLSYPDYQDLRRLNHSFSGLTASSFSPMDLTGAANPERVWGTLVSANYFNVLGVWPILGGAFSDAEEKQPAGAPVAVISYALWRTRYAGSRSVIGETIDVNRHPYTIVGVTPAGFQGSYAGMRSDLWIPVTMDQQIMGGGDRLDRRNKVWLELIGRLWRGVRREQAQGSRGSHTFAGTDAFYSQHDLRRHSLGPAHVCICCDSTGGRGVGSVLDSGAQGAARGPHGCTEA